MYEFNGNTGILNVELLEIEELEAKIAPDSATWDDVLPL